MIRMWYTWAVFVVAVIFCVCFAQHRTVKLTSLKITTGTRTIQVFKNLDQSNTLLFVSDRYWSKDYKTTDNRLLSCMQEVQVDDISYEQGITNKKGTVMADITTIEVVNQLGDIIATKIIAKVYRLW